MLCVGASLALAVVSSIIVPDVFMLGSDAQAAGVMQAPSLADPVKYTVKQGDTLSGIADAFNVKSQAIQDANGLQDPNAIKAGMVLTIPGSAPPPTPTPSDTKYTVKPGDTMLSIAIALGVKAQAIQDANGIQDPNALQVGQVLTIPGGPQAASAPAPAQPTPVPTPAPPADVKYTVKQGDTLVSIAASFGVKTQAIQDANGLQDPNSLKLGQSLTIPGAKTPAPAATPAPPPAPAPTDAPAPAATPAPTQASAPGQPTATPVPTQPAGDPRAFDQTGYRIDNDKFWDYFNRRGGVRTFGYPVSKEFTLLGFRVQFFQRLVMQLKPDGTVTTMNLLDDSMVPYTRMNFSTFPGPDKGMAEAAPKPGSDGYFDKLLSFAKDKSPDQWNDLSVNFYKTFLNTVKYEDAYPDKKQDPGIMPAINLELWGVPISPPAYDPTNKNFVYLRFQRGIMHFDKTTGATQGLLLGDYLKAIITGVNLPADLADQAKSSKFYLQYNSTAPGGLNRPADLPGTDMAGAFGSDGVVVIDPGHGGTEIGAAHVFPDNVALQEKNVNLKVALKTADILRKAGRQVQLTRTTDTQVNNPPKDVTGDGKMTLDDDLESRVDIANKAGAQLFLSIHFNGSGDPAQSGSEVYYNTKRPFSDKNKKFAQVVLDNLLATTKAAGFNMNNRGVKNDEFSVGKGNSLYLLGPTDDDKPRAAQMTGALVEGAFLTNDQDASYLKQDKFLDALAQGYAQAIQQWFQSGGK
jgi:N-acetylmuramoyl-L-alanine amidase/LysM repeat protein